MQNLNIKQKQKKPDSLITIGLFINQKIAIQTYNRIS
jgi:hypothetical protein